MKGRQTSKRLVPFLSLRDVTFRLGDRLIFENSTWIFHRHEQWAIIGSNGSGKSVLADCLRGRLPLVHGELRYHFRPPAHLSHEEAIGHVAFEDRKSELHGTVVQSRWNSFEEEASVRVADFLSYDLVMDVNPFEVTQNHAVDRPRFVRRIRQAISLLQIKSFLTRTLLSLSNGERQRIELARALAHPSRLLILDEPYIGLDAATRKRFHSVLERLLETRLRVLLITTRVDDLPRHVTHLLRVENCRIVAAGLREQVLSRYRGDQYHRSSSVSGNRLRVDNRPGRNLAHAEKGSAPILIELRNVTVRYGTKVILRNLNWKVQQGESWALLGPNGSGKTTLLSLILGDNPQAYVNEVFVFGQRRGNGESIWNLKRRIGWVSPELQLHFDDTISVYDAVLSGFYDTVGVFESPTQREYSAARSCLSRLGLTQVAELPLSSLSVGLQRMALLARALVKRPKLLVLDEPCQGLDLTHRDLVIRNVNRLICKRSVTTIFVTHRPEEIPRSVRRVLHLGTESLSPSQHRHQR
jgi:molybdate transport system ATP-binding protein